MVLSNWDKRLLAKHLGAVYVMSAVKQETLLRNHKPSWRAKIRRPQVGLAAVEGVGALGLAGGEAGRLTVRLGPGAAAGRGVGC